MKTVTRFGVFLQVLLVMAITACGSLVRNPVPLEMMDQAELAGMPGVRAFWDADEISQTFQDDIIHSVRQEPSDLFDKTQDGVPIYAGLALSGGGSSGAFGAGILCGWSKTGSRPTFKLVTGISTGALIAPYAFLGEAYDEKLHKVYTTTSTKDIAKISKRFPLRNDALMDTSPLAAVIAKDLDESMLADIATAHNRGRRLYIGTTNLDAQRFVVWNMGAIAASGEPGSLQLFRDIMLASASIPGVFPPVYINVDANGQTYDEMHVDGGVITQVFFYELLLNMGEVARTVRPDTATQNASTVYVIRNGKAAPEPQQVPRELMAIAGRSLSTMIKSASINDLLRIYEYSKQDGIAFNFTNVPGEFHFESEEAFDQQEMNALFDLGYQILLEGTAWQEHPFELKGASK